MSLNEGISPRERIRLNLELNADVKQRLDELQLRTDAASLTEVIRRSLALYQLVTEHQLDGGKVVLKSADGSMETLAIL